MLSVGRVDGRGCSSGWIDGPDHSCYKFVTGQKVTWSQAVGLCRDMGGHLTTLDSHKEIMWMKGYRSHYPELRSRAWIGGYKKDGRWMWKGEVTDWPMLLPDWAKGEPNNHNGYGLEESCVDLMGAEADKSPHDIWYRFNDESCTLTINYICEKSKE